MLLPNAENPIIYNLTLTSVAAPSDTLLPCRYLIEWTGRDVAASGFAAYFDGNFFRFRGGKLAEYHVADDVRAFAPGGNATQGVQVGEQFVSLLPVSLARLVEDIGADTAYTYSARQLPGGGVELTGSQDYRGYRSRDFVYRFDAQGLPEHVEMVTNPEMPSEQIITVNYSYSDTAARCPDIDEAYVASRYPEVFEKYRRDSFTLEKLRGEPLPSIAVPTITRERYSRERGDTFAAPTVIAVLDSSVDGTQGVVSDLRAAIAQLPFAADLVLAFTDKDTEAIEAITGPARAGEYILISARSLARDCGVADTPSFIFCRTDGTVSDIHVGRNNNMRDIVIQKASLTRN